jgi:hypothetical protein
MHTILVIAGGFALLGLCLLLGRTLGATPSAGLAAAALAFLPIWFVTAAVNMWVGVRRAGYSVTEEAPVFALVFAVPAAVALLAWWKLR